jgi:hypothetical protein
MVVYEHIMNYAKLEQLRKKFSRLTGVNQLYILGVSEGLKYAQSALGKPPEHKSRLPAGQEAENGGDLPFCNMAPGD